MLISSSSPTVARNDRQRLVSDANEIIQLKIIYFSQSACDASQRCERTRQDDRIRFFVFAHRPDHQSREISREDELSQWFARAPDGEGFTLLLAQVSSVDQTRDDMAIIEMEVVIFTENIRRNDGGEVATVLSLVHTVLKVHHALCVSVAFIGEVRWSVVNHGFVYWKRRLVREDASGEARHELLDACE